MGPSGGWSDELVCQALSKREPQQNLGPAAQEEPGGDLAAFSRDSARVEDGAARPEEYGCAVVGPSGFARAHGVCLRFLLSQGGQEGWDKVCISQTVPVSIGAGS